MRQLLFALFALSAAGVAQALTFDWADATNITLGAATDYRDQGGGYANGNGSYKIDGLGIAPNTSFAIKTSLSFTSGGYNWAYGDGKIGARTLGLISFAKSPSKQLFSLYIRNGTFTTHIGGVAGNIDIDTPLPTLKQTDNIFTFEYDATAHELLVTLNGTELFTLGTPVIPDFAQGIDFVDFLGGTFGSNWTGMCRTDTYYLDYVEYTTATVIPEPTALALLALGVSALALRRRVA